MERFLQAFRAFLDILFRGTAWAPVQPAVPAPAVEKASHGALQMLAILQRDSRLVDFLMEDISGYSDDQVGAAIRTLHDQGRQCLLRYVQLTPVIDGVEGTFTSVNDASAVKFLGNVPAGGRAPGGVLRHKGWRAQKTELPRVSQQQDPAIVAPAEIEIE